jgi:DNA-binding MarR family transcriptional regulator
MLPLKETVLSPAELAGELRLALGALMRQIRQERGFPLHHAALLGRLEREGPSFLSELAAKEKVRPQSLAQTIAELEEQGLIRRHPDPSDRRRISVEITAAGRRALARDRQRKEDRLAQAIADALKEPERAALERALPALRKLAER